MRSDQSIPAKEAARLMREMSPEVRNVLIALADNVVDIRHLYGVRKAPESA